MVKGVDYARVLRPLLWGANHNPEYLPILYCRHVKSHEIKVFSEQKGLHLYDHCWELAKTLVRR